MNRTTKNAVHRRPNAEAIAHSLQGESMSSSNACRQAYQNGLAERVEHPFARGSGYKINEIYSRYKDEPANLVAIGKYKNGSDKGFSHINHCMPFEMHSWVIRAT